MATAAMELGGAGKTTRMRFVATIFVGSFLLFLVQPMIARMALPRLGGAPSVWNSAMLVYQALLLAGYAYAHAIARMAPRRQAATHLAAFGIAALMLPIGLIAAVPSADSNPFVWVPWLFLVSIGPLFFVVSAQAPLMQRWFALSGGADPYPLYAASNLGSFGGLLTYPLLVEPLAPLAVQRWLWSAGYALLVLLVGWCALALPRSAPVADSARGARPSWRTIGAWVLLSAIPSGLILSTTLHLTTDIGAMPLLWVIPLGLYLLSFTFAFANRRWPARAIARIAPVVLLVAAGSLFINARSLELVFAAVTLLNLFAVSVNLHSQLFERRPDAANLTLFYLMLSVGGVIGGIFCALVAPLVFNWTYEHPLLLAAAALLLASPSPFERIAKIWTGDSTGRRLTLVGIPLVLALSVAGNLFASISSYVFLTILGVAVLAIGNRPLFAASVVALMITTGGWERVKLSTQPGALTRSYFGIYSVRPDGARARMLVHGTTVHGVQNFGSADRERIETTYYGPRSGVGLAMQAAPQIFGADARIDVVGLGAGTLACYARPGQRWTLYEIDPAVVRIARNPAQFTFLSKCLPDAPVIIGDARLALGQVPAADADLLVVDAFSSDAIPVHLLTREAFGVYRRRLAGNGLLLIHITNRFLDLEPVVAAAAATGGWHALGRWYDPPAAGRAVHETRSHWIALSQSASTLDRLAASHGGWAALDAERGFKPWTDDHAAVLPVIRWRS